MQTDVFQNLGLAYISCKYFKLEKIFHFPCFPGVILLRVLIDRLGGLSILQTDILLLNFAGRYFIKAIDLPNEKIRFLPTALKKSPARNVMKSFLSKQRCEISNLFHSAKNYVLPP